MAFSAPVNGVITQTGRDSNFSSLAGNAGVTITTDAGITYYDFGTNRLVITGTVFHDPEEEILIFHHISTSATTTTTVLTISNPANNWKNTQGYARDVEGRIVVTSAAHGYLEGDAVRFRLVTGSNLEQQRVRIIEPTADTFVIENSDYYDLPDSSAGQFNPIGCYNFGKEVTVNGRTRLADGVGIIFSGNSTNHWDPDEYSLNLNGFSYFWSRGGTIVTSRPFNLGGGAGYDLEEITFASTRSGDKVEIRSLGSGWWRQSKLVNIAGVDVSGAKEMQILLEGSNITEVLGNYYQVSIKDFDVSKNASNYDIGHDGNGTHHHRDYEILNSATGSDIRAMWRDTRGFYGQRGCVATKKEVSLNIKDPANTPIQGAKIYLQDNPSPYSKNATLSGGTDIGTYTVAPTRLNATLNANGTITYYYSDPLTYEHTTDASGNVPTFKVTTSVQIKEFNANEPAALASNGGPYNIPSFNTFWRETDNSGPAYSDWDTDRFGGFYRVDRRSDSNTVADDFTFKFCSYGHVLSESTQALKGVGELSINWILVEDATITETNKATVDAYTTIDSPEQFYDRAKSYFYDNYAGETATIVSRSGNTINAGSYNIVVDASAASVFAFDGSTITIKATQFTGNITSSGTFTLLNGAEILGTYGTTTVLPWTVVNVEAGSTVQIYNVTQSIEIVNYITSGTAGTKINISGSYSTAQAASGDTIRLRVTCQAGVEAFEPFQTFGVSTAAGIAFRADQVVDAVYNANNIDGSNITGIALTPDYTNIQIDIDDQTAPYEVSAQQIYNFYAYIITTTQGIANFYGAITPIDRMNYRINASIAPIKIQNTGTSDVVINGGRLYRDDNVSIIDTNSATGAGTGSLVHDTGFLLQYIQPQVEAAISTVAQDSDMQTVKNDVANIKKNANLISALI